MIAQKKNFLFVLFNIMGLTAIAFSFIPTMVMAQNNTPAPTPVPFQAQIQAAESNSDGDLVVQSSFGQQYAIVPITATPKPTASLLNAMTTPVPLGSITPSPSPSPPPFVEAWGTMNRATLCYTGPGAIYDVVSSVLEGVEVQLIGVGMGPFFIIDNPRFPGALCWVSQSEVNLPDYAFELPTFFTPPLPTAIPVQSGGGGGGGGGGGRLPHWERPEFAECDLCHEPGEYENR